MDMDFDKTAIQISRKLAIKIARQDCLKMTHVKIVLR